MPQFSSKSCKRHVLLINTCDIPHGKSCYMLNHKTSLIACTITNHNGIKVETDVQRLIV